MHRLLLLLLESVNFAQSLFEVLTEEGKRKSIGVAHLVVLLERCLLAGSELVVVGLLRHLSEILAHGVQREWGSQLLEQVLRRPQLHHLVALVNGVYEQLWPHKAVEFFLGEEWRIVDD